MTSIPPPVPESLSDRRLALILEDLCGAVAAHMARKHDNDATSMIVREVAVMRSSLRETKTEQRGSWLDETVTVFVIPAGSARFTTACSPMQRPEAQTFESAGANPATRTICLSRYRARMARRGDKLAGDTIASLDAPNASATFAHVVQCRDNALKTRSVPVQTRPWAPPVAIGKLQPV